MEESIQKLIPKIEGNNIDKIHKIVQESPLGHDEILIIETQNPNFGGSDAQIKIVNRNPGFAKHLGYGFLRELRKDFVIVDLQWQIEEDGLPAIVIFAHANETTYFKHYTGHNKVVIFQGMLYNLRDEQNTKEFEKYKADVTRRKS